MSQHTMYFQEECSVLPCVPRTIKKMKFVHLDGTDITPCGCENTRIQNGIEIVHDSNLFLNFTLFVVF
jgi:hypothetical protein